MVKSVLVWSLSGLTWWLLQPLDRDILLTKGSYCAMWLMSSFALASFEICDPHDDDDNDDDDDDNDDDDAHMQ